MAFDRVIYFGDSLTDNGRLFALSSQVSSQPVPFLTFGYTGPVSNGPVYSDIAPQLLGLATPSVINYAVAGARALGSQTLMDAIVPGSELPGADPALLNLDVNLAGQIGSFQADAAGLGDLSNTAASFFIGLNDLNSFNPTGLQPNEIVPAALTLADTVVAATLAAAQAAVTAGVGTVILHNVPKPTFFPSQQGGNAADLALAEQVATHANTELAAAAATLEAGGTTVEIINLYPLTEEIASDPGSFGFATVTDPYLLGDLSVNPAVTGMELDTIGFFDPDHPTTAMHGVLAAFEAATLRGDIISFLSDGEDRQNLTDGNELIFLMDGPDRVRGFGGTDTIFTGKGDDRVLAGDGNDIVVGGSGDDKIQGQNGNDFIFGGDGDDFVFGTDGIDIILGGRGADVAHGGDQNDIFFWIDPTLEGGTLGADFDLINGGKDYDSLFLAVDAATRVVLEAELATLSGKFGHYTLTSINMQLYSIENIVLLDNVSDFGNLVLPADMQSELDQAQAWNLI